MHYGYCLQRSHGIVSEFSKYCQCTFMVMKTTPFKKVTQHDFVRLYFFYPGILFIELDIPQKPVYLPFDWCLICEGCFTAWGACRVSKLGKTSKTKDCKIDWIEWEMCVLSRFGLSFCDSMHEYPRPVKAFVFLAAYWYIWMTLYNIEIKVQLFF